MRSSGRRSAAATGPVLRNVSSHGPGSRVDELGGGQPDPVACGTSPSGVNDRRSGLRNQGCQPMAAGNGRSSASTDSSQRTDDVGQADRSAGRVPPNGQPCRAQVAMQVGRSVASERSRVHAASNTVPWIGVRAAVVVGVVEAELVGGAVELEPPVRGGARPTAPSGTNPSRSPAPVPRPEQRLARRRRSGRSGRRPRGRSSRARRPRAVRGCRPIVPSTARLGRCEHWSSESCGRR